MKVFSSLYTADGFEIYWLREDTDTTLQDPENDLYYDEYEFKNACRDIIHSGESWDNEHFTDEELKEIKDE